MGDDGSTRRMTTYDQPTDKRHRHIPVDAISGVVTIEVAARDDENAVVKMVAST